LLEPRTHSNCLDVSSRSPRTVAGEVGRGCRDDDSVEIIRLLKFSAAFPADAALVRPSSMNNHVVDCISDEYDAAAWIDPSEQLFARRGLSPTGMLPHTASWRELSRWKQHAEEEEGLTPLRDVRTQASTNRCHSVRVTAPRSTPMNSSYGRISSLVGAYRDTTTTLSPRTKRTSQCSNFSRTTNSSNVNRFSNDQCATR
jgi:hypothetical protein